MNPEQTSESKLPCDLGATLGVLLLRSWLALRAIGSGIEKYAGTAASDKAVMIDGAVNSYGLTDATSTKVYGFAYYHGVPTALMDKFASEPLLPGPGLKLYDAILGPSLILLGLALLVGFATRYTLFAMGLLYTSLTFGLILINENSGVAWLGIHITLIALMLFYSKYNKFELTGRWKI
jgi:thiosulfate dehydrogenase [quinone] large subunit